MVLKIMGFGINNTCVGILLPLFTGYVILGKSFYLPKFQYLHLETDGKVIPVVMNV